MIYRRALQLELAGVFAAAFCVLTALMTTLLAVRIFGMAAAGVVSVRDVLSILGLSVLNYATVILVVSVLISVLLVLHRWYRDLEMVAWFSSGVSVATWVNPIFQFALVVCLLTAGLSFWARPYASRHIDRLKAEFAQRQDAALLTPGKFHESLSYRYVLFLDEARPRQGGIGQVFLAQFGQSPFNLLVARSGHTEHQADGSNFIVLEQGRRYRGQVGQLDYQLMSFQRYGMRLEYRQREPVPSVAMLSTLALLRSPTGPNLGEFFWRLSLPLCVLNLALLAVGLVHYGARQTQSLYLLSAIFLYLTYSNVIKVFEGLLAQNQVSFWLSMTATHGVVLLAGLGLLLRRLR